jgi:hypothetical protein
MTLGQESGNHGSAEEKDPLVRDIDILREFVFHFRDYIYLVGASVQFHGRLRQTL